MSGLQLADIQGLVLRRCSMPRKRHFLMKVTNPAAARSALGRMVSDREGDAPQITTAAQPASDREYCLQIGVTWPGLIALEVKDRVPSLSFKSFPAFVEGAAKRAETLGEVERSAPENWIVGFGKGDDHVLLTLYAVTPQVLESWSERLGTLCATEKAFQ